MKTHTPDELVNNAWQLVRITHAKMYEYLTTARAHYLKRLRVPTASGYKDCLRIDETAEQMFRGKILERYEDTVHIVGEESLFSVLPEIHKGRTCFLVDMVDGTDLLERGIPMWCSAVAIFDPSEPKILGCVVGLASGEIYFATHEDETTRICRAPSPDLKKASVSAPVPGPSDVRTLDQATIAFFGQKAGNFRSIMKVARFKEKLSVFEEQEHCQFRLQTLAGNPMMVRLIDRERDATREILSGGIDAVFEIQGQYPHDLVPGAFLAKKAGAYLCGLDGKEITNQKLAQSLLDPTQKKRYILASTKELADDLLDIFGDSAPTKKKPKPRKSRVASSVSSPKLFDH